MLWVGTYQAKGGKGLYPLAPAGDGFRLGEPETAIANASYGVWCGRNRTAYFVDEQEAGRVAAWARTGGGWSERCASGSGGALPCYLALHPERRFLAVANYGDGSLGLIALDPATGRIGELADVARHAGRGPDPERQASPHVHCVTFGDGGDTLYAVDLGLDRVMRYELQGGKLGEGEVAFQAPPASGPRHLVLDPDAGHAWLISELSAELTLLRKRGRSFVPVETIATVPEPAGDDNLGGHLARSRDGGILVTNRGHDSLVAFDIGDDGVAMRGWRPTEGRSPRHFLQTAQGVLVAHEESGEVTEIAEPGAEQSSTKRWTVPGAAFLIDIPD